MAVRDVVTMGFGSFSSVSLIPVLGYGLGVDYVAPSIPGAELALFSERSQYSVFNERSHFSTPEE